MHGRITRQRLWHGRLLVSATYVFQLSSARMLLPTGLGGQLVLPECVMLKQECFIWRLGHEELCTYYACTGSKHNMHRVATKKQLRYSNLASSFDQCYLVGSVGCCDQATMQLRLQNGFLVRLACVLLQLFSKNFLAQQTSCTCPMLKGSYRVQA